MEVGVMTKDRRDAISCLAAAPTLSHGLFRRRG